MPIRIWFRIQAIKIEKNLRKIKMKKIKLISFIAILGLLFASCKTDIVQPVVSSNPTAPTGTALTYTGTFDVNHRDSLMTFSWAAANFGFESSTTYYVQLTPDSSFTNNVSTVITTQKLTGTVKVSDINTLILAWKYPIGTPVKVYFRVAASVSSNVDTAFSSFSSTTLTPYDAVINYPMVYVPGAYQGWSPGAVNGRLFSYGFNSQYSGIVRIIDTTNARNASDFKITSDPDWNHTNWGGTLTPSGNNYSGTLDPSGGNFTANPACYVINVDVTALTITLTKTDDWGLIGDATPDGWNSDQNMFYNGQRKMWEITLNLVVGSIKFRANDDWTLNYGSNNNDGTLQSGGSNIPITVAGNYTIRFDPVALTYTIIKN
jgi:hypothetical protein